jgi:hypothetical protein
MIFKPTHNMENLFYVYIHINPIKNEIFYVGKGKGNRFITKFGRNNHWNNLVNKYGYDSLIIEENLSESEAFDLEIKYIKKIGRLDLGLGSLVNLSDGGDGIKNPSEESKYKMGASNRGKGKPESVRYKISETLKGNIPWNKGNKKDKDLVKKYQKEYQLKNREKLNAYRLEYYKKRKTI